jgi:hypothetical protein
MLFLASPARELNNMGRGRTSKGVSMPNSFEGSLLWCFDAIPRFRFDLGTFHGQPAQGSFPTLKVQWPGWSTHRHQTRWPQRSRGREQGPRVCALNCDPFPSKRCLRQLPLSSLLPTSQPQPRPAYFQEIFKEPGRPRKWLLMTKPRQCLGVQLLLFTAWRSPPPPTPRSTLIVALITPITTILRERVFRRRIPS